MNIKKAMLQIAGACFLAITVSCAKNSINCSASIDCSTVKYSSVIKPLVENKCGSCHSSYATFTGLKSIAENGALISQVVTTENMPPAGNMTCTERSEIECWVNAGAPEN